MMSEIFHLLKFQEFTKELEKMFSIGKNRILNPLEILRIPQEFSPHERLANTLTPLPANVNNANINPNR